MKKQIIEPDHIGGQGSLTKEEEVALSKYFSAKKKRKGKSMVVSGLKKSRVKSSVGS